MTDKTELTGRDAVEAKVGELRAFANGCRGSMWQSRDKTIELCDEAAALLTAQQAEIEARDAALQQLLADMEDATSGGMGWIDHNEVQEFKCRARAALAGGTNDANG